MIKRALFAVAAALGLALVLVAVAPARAGPVTVYAAASLSEALTAAAALYQKEGGGPLRLVFGASSALARQIETGAPADIFISANPAWMAHLAGLGRIEPGQVRPLTRNRLVLVVPAGRSLALDLGDPGGLAAALSQGPLAIAEPAHVPAGIYAKQALTALGVWPRLAAAVVPAKDARAALALVERGEAPAGVIYASDARGSRRVRVAAVFPETLHDPILYPMAAIGGRQNADVAGVLAFLASAKTRRLLEDHGFGGGHGGIPQAAMGGGGAHLFSSPSPLEREALLLSLKVAGVSTLATLPLALWLAWLLARRGFWGHGLVDGAVHLPLILPPVVVGYLLLVAFGRQGVLGAPLFDWFGVSLAFTWKGAALASAVMALPLVVRAMRQSLDAVDRRLEQAARTLGAGPARVFATITLPLMAPGIVSGAILGFARSLGEFGATITFVSSIPGQTRTLPLALYTAVQSPGGEAPALRLLVLSVIAAMAALAASEIIARRVAKRLGGRTQAAP